MLTTLLVPQTRHSATTTLTRVSLSPHPPRRQFADPIIRPADDQRVLKRDDAEVSQEDVTLATIYRIEYRSRQDLHKMAAGVLRKASLVRAVPLSGGSTMSGYLRERASNVKAPGFPDAAPAKPADIPSDPLADLLAGFTRPKKVAAKDAMYAAPPEVRRIGAEPPVQGARDAAAFAADVRAIRARASLHGGAASTSQLDPLPPPPPQARAPLPNPPPRQPRPSTSNLLPPPAAGRLNPSRPLGRTTSSQNPLAASFDYTPSQPLVNRHPLDPVRDHISTQSYVFQPFKAEVLPRGSFRVVLIVDTREMGTGRNKRTEMMDELTKLGVEVERRALPLGDMLWVARRKEARVDASGKVGGWDDVVLDAIVERKRLDDLCSSIRDGRYVSQKVRCRARAVTSALADESRSCSFRSASRTRPSITVSTSSRSTTTRRSVRSRFPHPRRPFAYALPCSQTSNSARPSGRASRNYRSTTAFTCTNRQTSRTRSTTYACARRS